MATIKIKRGTTDPTAAQVTNIGELAANTSTPKLFLKTATDSSTTPIWIGATIEASPADWTSTSKLATQSAINTTFMPKSGGAFTGDVTLNAQSDLRFADSDSSNWVAFQAPAAITSNVTWTLPSADGTNGQVLTTNGSGTLSWNGASATAVTVTSSNTGSTVYPVFVTAVGAGASLLADDTTGPLSYVPSTGELTVAGDINVNGGDVITSAASATLFNTNATTLSVGGAATTGTFGYSSTLGSTTNVSTGAAATGNTKTVNIGTGSAAGSTTNVNIGSTSGTSTVTIQGNLTVSGTTTTVNTTTLDVQDKNITVGKGNTTDAGADGSGITADATSPKTFQYDNTNTAWTSSENMNIVTGKAYKINGTNVLTGSALGSGVTGSSLTSVGTLTSGTLGSGFTTVATSVGGTGLTSFTANGAVYATSTSALTTGTLPVASGGTGITSFGTGVATWLGTPSSANLASAITDETGSGSLVFGTSPNFTTSVTTGSASFSAFNTNATTLNVGGAATTLTMGATSGTAAIRNATLNLGNTTATISTTAGTTNSLTIAPNGSLILTATKNLITGGNFPQILVEAVDAAAGQVQVTGGDLYLGTKTDDSLNVTPVAIIFEGVTANAFETTLTVTDPTADNTITLPNVSGTVITTGNLTSITTTGTITSGTWNGTAIGVAYGGTGLTSYTTGQIVYASGATTLAGLTASSTAGAVVASTGAGAAPEYKTISLTNGTVTSGSGTLTLAIQNAAADGSTKGLAAFNATSFSASSGVVDIATVDGGTY